MCLTAPAGAVGAIVEQTECKSGILLQSNAENPLQAAQLSPLPHLAVIRADFHRQQHVVLEDFLGAEDLQVLRQVMQTHCAWYTPVCMDDASAHLSRVTTQECDSIIEAQRRAVGGAGPEWVTSR